MDFFFYQFNVASNLILFFIGFIGIVVTRKNLILTLMSIELMLLSVNLNFLEYSLLLDDSLGFLFSVLILTVAAAEVSIGLAILIIFYRIRGIIDINFLNILKG